MISNTCLLITLIAVPTVMSQKMSESVLQELMTPLKTFGEGCGYEGCPLPKEGMLNVHIVPHSHGELGYMKTFYSYYTGQDDYYDKSNINWKRILDATITELWNNEHRKFTLSDTPFLFHWWSNRDGTVRRMVYTLVRQGRLHIVGGGWGMPDESCPSYHALIDSFTHTLRKLNKTFGACGRPLVAWQADVFGHSREFAHLATMLAFDGLFINPISYEDELYRMHKKELEMIWRGSDDIGPESDIFTHKLFDGYWSPPGFCFGSYCSDPLIITSDSLFTNVEERVNAFIDSAKNRQGFHYSTSHIMVVMGKRMGYYDALMWFKNIDVLIAKVNEISYKRQDKVHLMYSAPACYLKAVYETSPALPVKQDDFMPITYDKATHLTGLFTSRPTIKYMAREGHVFLQMVKQMFVLARLPAKESKLYDKLTWVTAVFQDHNVITGAMRPHVKAYYTSKMYHAVQKSTLLLTKAFNKLRNSPTYTMYYRCAFNISSCRNTNALRSFVVIYNPLAWPVTMPIRIPVVRHLRHTVFNPKLQTVKAVSMKISDAVLSIPRRDTKADHEIVFMAENLPPMGYRSYYIESTTVADQTKKKKRRSVFKNLRRSKKKKYLSRQTDQMKIDDKSMLDTIDYKDDDVADDEETPSAPDPSHEDELNMSLPLYYVPTSDRRHKIDLVDSAIDDEEEKKHKGLFSRVNIEEEEEVEEEPLSTDNPLKHKEEEIIRLTEKHPTRIPEVKTDNVNSQPKKEKINNEPLKRISKEEKVFRRLFENTPTRISENEYNEHTEEYTLKTNSNNPKQITTKLHTHPHLNKKGLHSQADGKIKPIDQDTSETKSDVDIFKSVTESITTDKVDNSEVMTEVGKSPQDKKSNFTSFPSRLVDRLPDSFDSTVGNETFIIHNQKKDLIDDSFIAATNVESYTSALPGESFGSSIISNPFAYDEALIPPDHQLPEYSDSGGFYGKTSIEDKLTKQKPKFKTEVEGKHRTLFEKPLHSVSVTRTTPRTTTEYDPMDDPDFDEDRHYFYRVSRDRFIKNKYVKVHLDDKNEATRVTLSNGVEVALTINMYYYASDDPVNMGRPEDKKPGTYVFKVMDEEPVIIKDSFRSVVHKTYLVEEVQYYLSKWAGFVLRVYVDRPLIELDWVVGPIPTADGIGKDVFIRYSTDLNTKGVFYTDSNGRQTIKRVRNNRPMFEPRLKNIPSNFYPVTSKIHIEDPQKNIRLSVFNDRAQGGSSLYDGQIDLMVHRRILTDDDGVHMFLNETEHGQGIVVRGKHFIYVSKANHKPNKIFEKKLAKEIELAPQVFASPMNAYGVNTKEIWYGHTNEFKGVVRRVPAGVHVLTLQEWNNGALLLRLENYLEKADSVKSGIKTVFIKDLFAKLRITSVKETTLGGNIWLEDRIPMQWNARDKFFKNFNDVYNGNGTVEYSTDQFRESEVANITQGITLMPQQIRTFIVSYQFRE